MKLGMHSEHIVVDAIYFLFDISISCCHLFIPAAVHSASMGVVLPRSASLYALSEWLVLR